MPIDLSLVVGGAGVERTRRPGGSHGATTRRSAAERELGAHAHAAETLDGLGEWLRREARRVDCREQLHTAHRMFTEIGAEAFAERAGRELLATGEKVRKRSAESLDELTAQQAQIARLGAEGQTNAEIAAQLFLSPRTVEWHLRKVFARLGIRSRRELADALGRFDPSWARREFRLPGS